MGGLISKNSPVTKAFGIVGNIAKKTAIRDVKKGIKEGMWHEIRRKVRGSNKKSYQRLYNNSSKVEVMPISNNPENATISNSQRNNKGKAGVSAVSNNPGTTTISAANLNNTGNAGISTVRNNQGKAGVSVVSNNPGNTTISAANLNNKGNAGVSSKKENSIKLASGGSRTKSKKSNS